MAKTSYQLLVTNITEVSEDRIMTTDVVHFCCRQLCRTFCRHPKIAKNIPSRMPHDIVILNFDYHFNYHASFTLVWRSHPRCCQLPTDFRISNNYLLHVPFGIFCVLQVCHNEVTKS